MQSGRPVSKSDERSRGESDFTILHDGHYLAMLVKTQDKTFNITCFQISSLTSENSIIHWNPVCLIEQGIHKGFAVLVSTYDNDNSLRDLLNECTTRCCVACIIVNPDEKFELLVTNVDLTQYNIPIYVIKKADGKRIQDICHSERDVHVRTEQSSELQKSSSLFSKFGKRLIRHTKIPEQLIKYICESWQADISYERAKDLFVQVILYLQKCDDDGRRHNLNFNMNDVFAHLFSAPIFTNVFSVTLPVYVYILAHIVSNEEVYLYNESGIAVDRVMQKCGVLIRSNPQTVMETIALYRPEKISGSLKIRWKNVGYSFLNLLDYWTTTKQQLPSDFFAKAIPMIIIAQTILKEAGESRSELQKQWGTHLLKYSEKANFRQGGSAGNHIQWLEEGLQFQVKIKSPSDCYFMPKHLKELVNPGRKLCTLLEARNVLLTLPKQLEYEWKTDFLVEFIMPLRASYRVVLKDTKYKDFRTVSSQGEWTGMITEGVGFIIAIEQFMKDSNCKEYFADKSFKWLKLLVRSVPFDQVQSENHTRYIDLLFSEETVIMKHCEEVKQMLLVKFRESLKSLTPNRFLLIEKYTKSKKITDDSIFKEYFQNCEIRVNENDLVCSKSEYLSVIQARVSRNPLGKQSDILEFFELVSKFYEKGDCPSDLFLDLVQLNVKGLLTSSTDSSLMETDETEFYQFLHKKNKPHVSNAILKELPTFIELPTRETTNPFQWLVCRVILEGLGGINFTKDLPLVKSTLEAVKDHFEVATRTLTADLNTPRIRFACGVLQLFTSKVSFRKESWVSDSPVSVLDLVTTIAPLFEKCQGITSGVPQEVQYCLSFFTDVRTRFESLDDLLRSECISYTTLEDLFKRNYEIKSVVEVVKPRGNKDIDFQTFDALYHKCLQIREDISHLVLLRCKIGVAKTVCYDSLMRVLGKYSVELPQELKKELLEIIDVELIEELIKDGSVEIEIPFNGAKTCVQLEILQRNLSTFLGPIKGKLPVFCFFHHFKSSFFSNFVKKKYSEFLFVPLADNVSLPESSSHDSCIEMLNLAVESAINTVVDAVKGNVTLQQMELDLSQDTSAEFAIFEFYVKEFCNCCEHKGHEGIDALLSLANIRNGMLSIEEVCTQCELVHCLENPTFRELSMYAEMLRTPETIVLNQAPEIKAKFCQSLPNYDGDFDIYFMLFKELKNSFAYIHFCRKMGFVGEEGKRSFYAQRNLVTQEIQYMLEQTALDDLWDAYTTLYYFIDSSITYNAWMNGLEQLGNIQTRVNQIKALRQHSLVQLERIFNRQESLTKEIISKKLCNMFDGASVVYSAEKHAPVTMEVQMNYEGIEEKWDLKTLSEFAANVELLQIDLKDELDSELDNNIHLFLKIYEVSLNILELLKMLKLAGNFEFQEVNYSHKFSGQDLKWDNLCIIYI